MCSTWIVLTSFLHFKVNTFSLTVITSLGRSVEDLISMSLSSVNSWGLNTCFSATTLDFSRTRPPLWLSPGQNMFLKNWRLFLFSLPSFLLFLLIGVKVSQKFLNASDLKVDKKIRNPVTATLVPRIWPMHWMMVFPSFHFDFSSGSLARYSPM